MSLIISALAFFLSLITFSTGTQNNYLCPVIHSNSPCTCMGQERSLSNPKRLLCNDFNSSDSLLNTFNSIRGHHFSRIELEDGDLTSYPVGLFKNISSLKITLKNIQLDETFNLSKDGATIAGTLESLAFISVSGLEEVDWLYALSQAWFLKEFSISDSPMRTIPNYFGMIGAGGAFLDVLKVQKSGVRCIDDLTFAPLHHVKIIDLSFNQISHVSRKMFPICLLDGDGRRDCLDLVILNLGRNRLRSLPSDLFDGFFYLKQVFLDGNEINFLSQTIIPRPAAYGVISIKMNENPIECDCDLKWLLQSKEIRLSATCRNALSLEKNLINLNCTRPRSV